jgi:hypothetical protein
VAVALTVVVAALHIRARTLVRICTEVAGGVRIISDGAFAVARASFDAHVALTNVTL